MQTSNSLIMCNKPNSQPAPSECEDEQKVTFERSDVQGFISLLDSIINRMASNSANAKNWLMTIIAAATAIQWNQNSLHRILWLLVPTVLFFLTDLYYLGMERRFKRIQKRFIKKVRDGKCIHGIIYHIPPTTKGEQLCNMFNAWDSLSILPFYLIVIIVIIAISFLN